MSEDFGHDISWHFIGNFYQVIVNPPFPIVMENYEEKGHGEVIEKLWKLMFSKSH